MRQERKSESNTNLMTQSTYESLLREIEAAQGNVKQSLLDIGEAAGTGSDWHDNAAFDHANIKHDVDSLLLSGLTSRLKDVEIIKPSKKTDQVRLGNEVLVRFEGESENESFTVLGPADSKRRAGWISYDSPLGESLMGKRKGDIVSYVVSDNNRELNLQVRVVEILPGNF
jgi:transcription elongation factor GreA